MNVVDDAPVAVIARRPFLVKAIQFTGSNGRDVVTFAKGLSDKVEARNGGSYVSIHYYEHSARLRKNDWLVHDADGVFRKYDVETFAKLFSSK